MIGLATVLGKFVPGIFDPTNMIMVYLLCVVATAFLWGFGPSIMASILGVLVFDFLFISPFFTFTVDDTRYILTFIVLLVVGLIISYLMRKIRQQTDIAVLRQRQTAALYALGRDLAISSSLEAYVSAIAQRLRETFGRDAIIYLPAPSNNGALKPHADRPDIKVNESEMAAAIWSYQHQKVVGRGTDTLPSAAARYLPMVTNRGTIGVLALQVNDSGIELTAEQERLLEAYVDLAAVAIEGIQLGEEVHNAQVLSRVLRDTEKLQTALLNSISHDLRTPLVSVIGTLSSLQEEGIHLDEATRKNLIQTAREEAERLNRLITNLLDVSRLEAGAMKITRQPAEVQNLVGTALEQLGDRTRGWPITIDIPENLPFVSVDFDLIVQALVNILDNALKYSPSGSPVDIEGRQIDQEISLTVSDRGIGIPPQDLDHVFDKFYRVHRPEKINGTGLGLSISRGIIEAQGGHIEAENRPQGGTVIRLLLPIAELTARNEKKTMNDKNPTILIVDDEPSVQRFLELTLSSQGYEIIQAVTGKEALSEVSARKPDLVILDLGLPDIDGLEVTRQLRQWTQVPIIVLSVRGSEKDKVAALDAGADDYLTKPFGTGELLARIRVVWRHRSQSADEPLFMVGNIMVDLANRIVKVSGQEIQLTPTEYDILKVLVSHAGRVMTHRQILQGVWGAQYGDELHMLHVNISNLRRKIEPDPARPHYIITESGVGYRLRVEQ